MKKVKFFLKRLKKLYKNRSIKDACNFQCNVCGVKNVSEIKDLSREVASCDSCGSTVRMRSIVHVLSMELFGESLVLTDFPVNKDMHGIGMSDWDGYAKPLTEKFDYKNTYYHQEPKLDITSISEEQINTLDFIISTDVYEHVLSPVSLAFENTKKLLKKDGVFVFTVPYTKEGEETKEHFGELNDFEIVEKDNKYILKDVDKNGVLREFDDLIFHGGPGSTLEMRVFSEKSLMRELENSGFDYIKIYKEPFLKYGIHWDVDWSLPIAVRCL